MFYGNDVVDMVKLKHVYYIHIKSVKYVSKYKYKLLKARVQL